MYETRFLRLPLLHSINYLVSASIVVACLIATSSIWRFTPDGGIHIATAFEMIENHRFWFGQNPNLMYYPGTSSIAALVFSLPGNDFLALNIYLVLQVSVIFLLFARVYRPADYGLAAVIGLVLFASNGLILSHAFAIRSNAPFLLLTLSAFLSWRNYQESHNENYRYLTIVLVALSALFRVEGILLLSAFVLADLFSGLSRYGTLRSLRRTFVAGLMGVLPFILWTARNFLKYTPDTYNTLGYRFFEQKSRLLYAPDSLAVEGEPAWLIPIKSLLLMADGLLRTILSDRVGDFIPFIVSSSLVLGLMCLGFKKWREKTHLFEVTFVVLVLVLFCYMHFSVAPGRLVVTRYWTAILPPVIIMMVFGALRLIDLPAPLWIKRSLQAFFLGALLLGVAHGAASIRYYDLSSAEYAEGQQAMRSAGALVESTTDANEIVAVTDFGVMPFFLGRKTVKTLNDRSNAYTLSLLGVNQVRFLIIVDGLDNRASPQSKIMVQAHPQIFTLINSYPTESGLFSTHVFQVNQSRLAELASSGFFSRYCGTHYLFSIFCTDKPSK